jgi:hypothetical protein
MEPYYKGTQTENECEQDGDCEDFLFKNTAFKEVNKFIYLGSEANSYEKTENSVEEY